MKGILHKRQVSLLDDVDFILAYVFCCQDDFAAVLVQVQYKAS